MHPEGLAERSEAIVIIICEAGSGGAMRDSGDAARATSAALPPLSAGRSGGGNFPQLGEISPGGKKNSLCERNRQTDHEDCHRILTLVGR